jgi:hypothetical protein
MTDTGVSRDELTARLETIEAKAEGRQGVLDGKLDRVLDQMAALSRNVSDYRDDVKTVNQTVKSENLFTRWTLIGTVIAVALGVLGLLLTFQGSMTTANGNVLGAFQAGAAAQALKTEAPTPPPAPVQQPAKK